MVDPTLQTELKILDTPDNNTHPLPCALICSGIDKHDETGDHEWRNNRWPWSPDKAYKTVNMTGCGFVSPPVVTATIKSQWWSLCPSIAEDYVMSLGFFVHTEENATAEEMRKKKCDIHWIATGYNC